MKHFYHSFLTLLLASYPKFCQAARPSPEDIYGYGAKGGTGLGETFDTILMSAILLGLALWIVTTGKTKGFLKGATTFIISIILPVFPIVEFFMILKPSLGKLFACIIATVLYYYTIRGLLKFFQKNFYEK